MVDTPGAGTGAVRLGSTLAGLLFAACVLLAQPAQARYQTGGFELDELVAVSGAGPDPGPGSPTARLKWAVETAVPREWRESVRVEWTVGPVSSGHLALSYLDGRTVLSPRVMSRSAEEVLATVAHEMGHQVAFALVSPILGYPPQQFVDMSAGHEDVRERWADCVAQVWTGSTIYTRSEPGPCPRELADYVAGQLADPSTLGATTRIVPPPIAVAPAPAPPPPPAAPAPPAPVPSPSSLFEFPDPRPRSEAAPPAAAAGSDGLLIGLLLVPFTVLVCAGGYWYLRSQSPAGADFTGTGVRKKSRRP